MEEIYSKDGVRLAYFIGSDGEVKFQGMGVSKSGALWGDEAAARGRQMLMEATGADNIDDAIKSALQDPEVQENLHGWGT